MNKELACLGNTVTCISEFITMEERGWDPEIKKYFRKIIGSFTYGLLWIMSCATAGIYYKLGYRDGKPLIYTILFYAGMLITLLALLRYLYNTWKKEKN